MPVKDLNLAHINEEYSNYWRAKMMLGNSKIAVLFPNELQNSGGAFKSKVKVPIMTKADIGTNWNQKDGIPLSDSIEEVAEVELEKNINVNTKIAPVNVPADANSWAGNKAKIITQQEAKIIDNYVLEKLATGVVNKIKFDKITKDNIVDLFTELEKQADDHEFDIQDCIIFISPDVKNAIIKSKISTVNRSVANTSINVTSVFDTFKTVTARIDKLGFELIALPILAFGWAKAVDVPLQSYIFNEGEFKGQLATVMNEFYGGKILQPEFIIGVEKPIEEKSQEEPDEKLTEGTIQEELGPDQELTEDTIEEEPETESNK